MRSRFRFVDDHRDAFEVKRTLPAAPASGPVRLRMRLGSWWRA
ncbi:hypothetical protein [Streptomyces flavalbus]|uniref:Uncharacterized protein n=1 Tax=Streptomyces flavalbus TaxID=2665155 RepID=A0ABW2WKD5_9ACTN